ncbi:PTS sugar transporter subunit IIA [Streptococcus mutans]|jgi:Phosphotransferase system mannitol/fructose-specific IIA domain (Ntr-type)|uniref:PTS sugar transporter subunit IIA n=2 Tax=Streptococcus mutans TaxID=1309 RepID=A0AAX1K307_STRMG|nr:PTS sugar transporter subunit IIA [Streptococcus mutans]AVM71157.1 PTS mannitol transporter subunit IIB [Streptococcus mutans]EMB53030.1 Putative PTS system, mannitol/fructose-specific IIA component [Streptococcus mutans 1ID3]EMB56814.1 Putative PTS system, mannitol/fructose-specific IIA component [Streptococcus mutans 11A1]EMB61951.1 Putative PTS system, mannitol/fructose-specific IIA component [Streptococcus mutans 1SM1]EMB68303.1 Putative PTS system, mannitol/fructose-specific IIA compon
MSQLFSEDTVFISKQKEKEEVFKEIAGKLLERKLVTSEYINNLIEREKNYPTALSLSPIDTSLPNIAIPHTESEYVTETRIVPVKLKYPIVFHNMILPDEEVTVSFLFMILNHNESEQAGLLAGIMDFINRQSISDLKVFFNLEDSHKIFDYLKQHY